MMSGRNRELDILKAFGIFLMVFDHVGWGDLVHTYIQSFHMPLFFIVSGYLWKPEQNIKKIAIRRFKTVLVPYFSFVILYLMIMIVASIAGLSDKNIVLALRAVLLFPTDMQNMPFAPALWFLPCFYFCNLIYAFLTDKLGKNKWIAIMLLAAVGFIYSTLMNYMLPFTLEPLMITPLFMLVGESIKANNDKIFHWLDKCWILLVLIVFDGILVYINGSCDLRSARYHNCGLYIVDAILGTLIIWGIVRKIVNTYKIKMTRLTYLSIHSVIFLCVNQIAIMLCENVFDSIMTNNSLAIQIIQKLITLIMAIIICIAMNECLNKLKLQFMVGK